MKFRSKFKNTRGQAFNKLRKPMVIGKATKEQIDMLKEYGIEIEAKLTEIRANYLIKEHKKSIQIREEESNV